LGKTRSGLKWERAEIGEKSGAGKRMCGKTGMHEKNIPKTQQIWHLGTSLGGYRPVSYIFFGKIFSDNIFIADTIPLS